MRKLSTFLLFAVASVSLANGPSFVPFQNVTICYCSQPDGIAVSTTGPSGTITTGTSTDGICNWTYNYSPLRTYSLNNSYAPFGKCRSGVKQVAWSNIITEVEPNGQGQCPIVGTGYNRITNSYVSEYNCP